MNWVDLIEDDHNTYPKEGYDDWLNGFMETIDRMKKIDPDPNKVRCVFFFDN